MAGKLAGAPADAAAGVRLAVMLGDHVEAGQPLFDLHAQTAGELEYAQAYVGSQPDIVTIAGAQWASSPCRPQVPTRQPRLWPRAWALRSVPLSRAAFQTGKRTCA